ncbi:MAG TPA: flagellar hook-associated protein FlgK [Acetobacteraceae bacterium]|jgi:flagellar hook-associated protein 1|nr:flagellar hook-associated protein FlgK [Acetobacteraceae bacterium]
MSLDSALSIAAGGLANINTQFALVSQNVANAATPGYALEVSNQQSVTADGIGMGVRTGPATLQIDQALQSSVVQQNAIVSGGQTTQTALQAIDSVLGTPGSGTDLGSLLGNLQNTFSALLTDPSNQTQQSAVVSSATSLAQGINSLSAAYGAQRQAAQDGIASAVGTLNSTLATIGQLSNQIIALKPTNQSSADLENQRNAAVQTLSRLVDIKTAEQPNGDLAIFTTSGLTLPTRDGATPFSIADATTPVTASYPGGGLPGIMLNGGDVTSQMTGGQIGANITLRDTTLPTDQAELDEFSQGLSSRFAAQGLALFTDPTGNVPSGGGAPAQSGYVGYAATIQVSPTVSGNPSLVRDGTNATGTFTPNPTGGPAGFTALINNVINYTFGTQSQSGVSQPALNTNGLGPAGNLAAPFNATNGALSDFASSLVSSQAQQSATATANLTTQQALQTSLNARATAVSGVNMDTEMSQMLSLQNAYSANARVISAVQSMFTQLLQAVQ